MLATLCFIDLFFYKISLYRKWVRLKCVSYLLLDALFSSIHITYVSIFSNYHAHLNGYKERACGRQPIMFYFLFCCVSEVIPTVMTALYHFYFLFCAKSSL